jgi:monofunctional biosynthetic peptidoglycan transglycosylase
MLGNRIVRTFVFLWFAFFFVLGGFLVYTLLSLPDVTELISHNPPTTSFIEYRKGEAKASGEEFEIRRQWIDLQHIPEILQHTVVISEDAAFWSHKGVDWFEVKKSILENLEEGKRLRGASTITQQTAKNLYLNPNRNFYRKFQEFIITRDLEKHLTKQRILELYLNCIEFDEGIFGIRSASQFYFGKSPYQLELDEMVRLVAVIPNPIYLNPRKPTGELRWRSYEILRRLYRFRYISEENYLAAKAKLNHFFYW